MKDQVAAIIHDPLFIYPMNHITRTQKTLNIFSLSFKHKGLIRRAFMLKQSTQFKLLANI